MASPCKMNFFNVTAFTALTFALVSAASRFVRIQGLEGDEIDGVYAAVIKGTEKTGNRRVQVLAVVESQVMSFDPTSTSDFSAADFFFNTLVKPENLSSFEWNLPQQRPVDEIIAAMLEGITVSNWVTVPLTPETLQELDRVTDLLWKICKEKPEEILADNDIELRFRAIGVWICQKYGFQAMVYVCERNPRMSPFIERVWNGIGVWRA